MLPSLRELETKFEYSPESGRLTWKENRHGVAAGTLVGSPTPYGRFIEPAHGRRIRTTAIAYKFLNGCWPADMLAHRPRNGDWADLRPCNLYIPDPEAEADAAASTATPALDLTTLLASQCPLWHWAWAIAA
jgi:hypothetical protein